MPVRPAKSVPENRFPLNLNNPAGNTCHHPWRTVLHPLTSGLGKS